MRKFLSALMVTGALMTPVVMNAADKDHDRDDHRRYYDSRNRDYHQWNENEDRAYRHWVEQERHQRYKDWKHASKRDQQQYWQWRHEHSDWK